MRIEKITEKNTDKKHIKKVFALAGDIIKKGGLVAFPTETVYGLGADALNQDAAAKIYGVKGRPSDNPLIVHVADFEGLEKIIKEIPWQAEKLAEKFWPGPLTMIMNKADIVPKTTSGGLNTVAVRMPSNKIALELIRASGGYIAAPSANTSGKPSPTRAEHVVQDLSGKIDLLIDGGDVGIGIESTIIDLTSSKPTILRPGAITQKMLCDVIGEVEIDEALIKSDSNTVPKAPGMKYRHYAPKADITVVEGKKEDVVKYINRKIEGLLQKFYKEEDGQQEDVFEDIFHLNIVEDRIGILCSQETIDLYPYGYAKSVGHYDREEEIARNLYAVLRDFDKTNVEIIFSESFYTPNMGAAIMNRLLKAAGHKIIHLEKEDVQ